MVYMTYNMSLFHGGEGGGGSFMVYMAYNLSLLGGGGSFIVYMHISPFQRG